MFDCIDPIKSIMGCFCSGISREIHQKGGIFQTLFSSFHIPRWDVQGSHDQLSTVFEWRKRKLFLQVTCSHSGNPGLLLCATEWKRLWWKRSNWCFLSDINDRHDVYQSGSLSATSACGAASNLLLRADNTAKSLAVSSRDGEGQLENSRESCAQVEEMTRAWQEVSAAGSLLQSPSLEPLAATPAPGKVARAHARTHTHLRSSVQPWKNSRCASFGNRGNIAAASFSFSWSDKTFQTK